MTDYRTVPVEPTEEMWRAASKVWESHPQPYSQNCSRAAYRAMLAAAPALSASPAPAGDLVERVARAIADGLGDNFDHAFVSKPEWTTARGEKGGRYRDINEPMQPDYIEAARAVIAAMQPGWRDMESAPLGCITEDVGCRGASHWFLGRPSPEFRDQAPPFVVIRRRAWPHEDCWQGHGDVDYVARYFDAWQPLPAPPGVGG